MLSVTRAHVSLARVLARAVALPAFTRGLAAAAPRKPRRRVSPPRHTFFVQRAVGGGFAEVEVAAGASVSALVDATVAKLRLDAPPDTVTLALAGAAAGAPPLDATLSLEEALAAGALAPRAKLLVTVRPADHIAVRLDLATFSNVLSRGPDAALGASLLTALADARTDAPARVAALNALVADVVVRDAGALCGEPSLPIFQTVAHASLLETLVGHARALVAGDFEGSNGTACRTLVGPRGIGKTVLLRAFAAVAASAFPSLVVVYVTGEGVKQRRTSSFRAGDLGDVIEAAARARGADAVLHSGPRALHAALRLAGLRVLLLLDEVDELYRVTEADGDARTHVLSSLGALQATSSSTTGLFGVLACGSSASTHALICADAQFGDKFPLVRAGVPDLNDTKFRRLSIETAPCSRSDEVAAILASRAAYAGRDAQPAELLKLARQLTFFVGVAPRAILAALPSRGVVDVRAPITSHLSEPALNLYAAVLDALVVANAELRALTLNDDSLKSSALTDAECPWEKAVRPLEWVDVQAAWARAASGAGDSGVRDNRILVRLVDDLADAQLVHIEEKGGSGMRLWPTTAAQVVAARARPSAQPSLDLFDVGAKLLLALVN
jgi:hypothetical protein